MGKGSKVSRRNVLLVAGGAAAAGALAAAPFRQTIAQSARELAVSLSQARRLVSLADASFEAWQAQVGSLFAIGGGASMRLIGVRALTSGGARPSGLGRARAFAAFFEPACWQTMAGDLIYTASHGQYGPLQLFLSAAPDARMPARMLAVFN